MSGGRWERRLFRSLLFAPGSHSRRLQRVVDFGSDVIVLDLEDAVADAKKEEARGLVRDALAGYDTSATVTVRVNSVASELFREDVAAVVCDRLDGLLIPKVETVEELAEADRILAEAERRLGLEVGWVRVIAILESALGVSRSEHICASAPARLFTVCFGIVDFALDIGIDLTGDPTEALYARSRIVIAARAGGLAPPIDGPWLWLDDDAGLTADTMRSRRLGFQGRVVVYPSQVEHVQAGYGAMSEDEISRETKIVQTFEEALANGSASVRIDGVFVDYPIYERAKRKLHAYRGSQGAP